MLSDKDAKLIYDENIRFLNKFFISKLGENDESLYLAHKTISNVILNYNKYNPIQGVSFKSWLKRVANNNLIDYVRKEKSIKFVDEYNDLGSYNEYSELITHIKNIICKNEYQIFEDYYIYGKTLKELSIENNTNIKSIKNRLYYIKNKIKKKLDVN